MAHGAKVDARSEVVDVKFGVSLSEQSIGLLLPLVAGWANG